MRFVMSRPSERALGRAGFPIVGMAVTRPSAGCLARRFEDGLPEDERRDLLGMAVQVLHGSTNVG